MQNFRVINNDTPIAMMTWGQMREGIKFELSQLQYEQPQKEVLTIEEVAELTGYKVQTIYTMCSNREIPYRKPKHGGKRNVFVRAEIEEWLMGDKIEPTADIIENRLNKLIK